MSEETGINIYVVGGACRDSIVSSTAKIARQPKDIDFCVESPLGASVVIDYLSKLKDDVGDPKYKIEIDKNFDKIGTMVVNIEYKPSGGNNYVSLTGVEFAMTRREIYDGQVRRPSKVEFAPIEEDALRRDFCCNAVYYNVRTDEFIDPTGKGISDAQRGIFRTVKDPETSFREDPLRMIRCIRFWHTTKYSGGSIEENTLKALHYYPEYDQLSLDLIRPELEKILVQGAKNSLVEGDRKSSDVIRFMHERGLLKHIIPELEEAWGFNQNSPYHTMNLSDHLLSTLDWVQIYSMYGCHGFTQIDDKIVAYSALLHDISKYKTYQIKKDNYFSFHNHEQTSAEMAEEILTRLGYSKQFSSDVGKVIRCHVYLKQLWDPIAKTYDATDRQTRKIWEKIAEVAGNYMREALALIDANNNTHAPKYCRPNQVYQFDNRYKKIEREKQDGGSTLGCFWSRMPELPDGNMIKNALKLSKEDLPVISQVRTAMKDIVPLQVNYSKMTKEDIMVLYLSLFDQNFYIRLERSSYVGDSDYRYYAHMYNPYDASEHEESLEIVDKLTIARLDRIFEKEDGDSRFIDPDILRKQVKGALINTDDERVLVINAQTFPWILIKYRVQDQINKSFKKITEGLREIAQLPDLSSIEIIDKDGDVTANIEFYNGDRKVII